MHETARRVVEFDRKEELEEVFSGLSGEWMALGGGNNVLFTKTVTPTLIIPCDRSIEIEDETGEYTLVRAGAGVEWDDLVAWSVERDLWGAENLSLIPGKVGASPVQNIGAYGAEAKDVISRVEVYFPEQRSFAELDAAHCAFAYRDSVFKHALKGRTVITSVQMRFMKHAVPKLGYGDVAREVEALGGPSIGNIRNAICSIRRSKLPDPSVTGNAGSFFKNPVVDRKVADRLSELYPSMPRFDLADPEKVKLAAGWLIDRAGLKGYGDGKVGVHPRQALVLVNLGGATGGDVVRFSRFVVGEVASKFGIEISPEVNII